MKVSFRVTAFEDHNSNRLLSVAVLINDKASHVSSFADTIEDLKSKIPKMVEKAKEMYLRSHEVEQILNGAVSGTNDNQ